MPREIWIDCGYEDTSTGDRKHLSFKKEDVRSYFNEKNDEIVRLRKEIKRLKKELEECKKKPLLKEEAF